MAKQKEIEAIEPEWVSEEDVAKWLGVTSTTLYRWRSSLSLDYTNINGKTVMYDKKQINEILYNNSTYAVLNPRK